MFGVVYDDDIARIEGIHYTCEDGRLVFNRLWRFSMGFAHQSSAINPQATLAKILLSFLVVLTVSGCDKEDVDLH